MVNKVKIQNYIKANLCTQSFIIMSEVQHESKADANEQSRMDDMTQKAKACGQARFTPLEAIRTDSVGYNIL